MNKGWGFKVRWWWKRRRCGTNRSECRSRSRGTSRRMKRVAFRGWFKRKKRDIFLNPFEAKRLNRNFLLSGAMQGPHHFLCFALMCLQREEGRLNTALLRARKHSSATFSWLRFAVDLCGRDTEPEKQQPPPTMSHSRHAFREGILTSHQVPARGLVLRIMVLQWSPTVFLPWVWAIVHFYIIWRWDANRCLCFCAQLWWTRKRLERFIGADSLQVSFNVH